MRSLFHFRIKEIRRRLGPGIIAGASDDDPSGILTHLIAGAQTGLSLLWLPLLTIPLMASIQEMCARIGLVTKRGLMGNLKLRTPKLVLYTIAVLVFLANTFNLAADLSGITATLGLVVPFPPAVLGFIIVVLVLVSLIFFSYRQLALIFRWLTLPLLAYFVAVFISGISLKEMFLRTIFPQIEFSKTTLIIITALLVLSNLVGYFIIATASATFHEQGITTLSSIDQATRSLVPLAGQFATLLFAIGLLGTGVLAIPVLAGSAAYVISESFGWPEGLGRRFGQAPKFYLVIILSTLLGFAFSILSFDPIKLLFYTAIIYGVLSPLLILLILVIANNRSLMGDKVNGRLSNLGSVITFLVMSSAAASLLFAR